MENKKGGGKVISFDFEYYKPELINESGQMKYETVGQASSSPFKLW